MRSALLIVAAVLALATPFAVAAAPNQALMGTAVPLGQGQVWSFITTDDAGNPDTVGVEFTEAALSGLPAEIAMIEVDVPSGIAGLPIDHVLIDWNPEGHEPPGVYTVPHFDFHFYLVPKDQVSAIKVGSCTTQENAAVPNPPGMAPVPCDIFGKAMLAPANDMMPDGYTLVPAVVPMMGNHLMDMSAPEFTGKPFTYTYIWGLYDGKLTFMEPMITKAFFETGQDVTLPLKMPKAMPKAGVYPTEMQIQHLTDSKTYVVSLGSFKEFPASSAAQTN